MAEKRVQAKRSVLIALIVLAVIAIGAVCLHSVEEVHYLKSFFPPAFTVQETLYAATLELIKVVILGIPLVLIIAVCLSFLRQEKDR